MNKIIFLHLQHDFLPFIRFSSLRRFQQPFSQFKIHFPFLFSSGHDMIKKVIKEITKMLFEKNISDTINTTISAITAIRNLYLVPQLMLRPYRLNSNCYGGKIRMTCNCTSSKKIAFTAKTTDYNGIR
jgi:hypothetical protein